LALFERDGARDEQRVLEANAAVFIGDRQVKRPRDSQLRSETSSIVREVSAPGHQVES
jgi:hypothetical protein